MSEQIAPQIKEARSKILIELCARQRDEYIEAFVGKAVEVLFEQRDKNRLYEGKTSNYITVRVQCDEELSGCYRSVVKDSVKDGIAFGHIVD